MSNDDGRKSGSKSIGGSPRSSPDTAFGPAADFYEFGPFRLEPNERRLLRGDEIVALTPRAFDTLHLLVRNNGHLLAKDDLIRMLWPDTFVEEGSLSNNIFLLRKALGDDPEYIETVPRRGYRFVATVRRVSNGVPPSTETSQEDRSGIADTISTGRPSGQAESAIPSRARTLGLTLAIVLVLSGAFGWKTFRILTLTTDHNRMQTMMDALRRLHVARSPGAQLFYFATRDDLRTIDPLAIRWCDGNGGDARLV